MTARIRSGVTATARMPSSEPASATPSSYDTCCLIGGVRREGNGAIAGSWNPSDGSLVDSFAMATDLDLSEAVSAAAAAAETWAHTPPATRHALIVAWLDAIEAASGLVDLIGREIGLTAAQAQAELSYGTHESRELAPSISSKQLGHIALVTTGISPIAVPLPRVAAALLAGNTVVWRPPLDLSVASVELAALAFDLPAGVLNVILGDSQLGHALAAAPVAGVHIVSRIGQARRLCGEALAAGNRVYGEISGSSSVIVLPPADLQSIAEEVVHAGSFFAGQASGAVKRVVVDQSIYDDFSERLAALTAALHVGDTADGSVEMGPLADPRTAQTVADDVRNSLAVGCRAIAGGSRLHAVGESFFAPTVLSIPAKETYVPEIAAGPVVMIAAGDGVESMSLLAAAPVTVAIMGGNLDLARALANRLDAATVQIGSLPKPHLHETLFGERAVTFAPGGRYPLTQRRSVTP